MNVTFHGQPCRAVDPAGETVVLDPFVREDELARDVDVPALPADGRPGGHGGFSGITHAADLGNRPGARLIANGNPTPGSTHDF